MPKKGDTRTHKGVPQLYVRRKAYTTKGGRRVAAGGYWTRDRGRRGGLKKGEKPIKLKAGGLGGAGYLELDATGRHRRLNASVKRSGLGTTVRRVVALQNLGVRDLPETDQQKLRGDRRYLDKLKREKAAKAKRRKPKKRR